MLCATTTEFNSTLSLNTLGTIVSNLSAKTAQLACKRISSLIKVLKSNSWFPKYHAISKPSTLSCFCFWTLLPALTVTSVAYPK